MRPGARRRAPFFALRLLPCRAPAGRRRGLGTGGGGGRKRGLCAGLQAEFTAEVERLAALAAGSLGTGEDLAAVELAIRTAMLGLGGSLLERLLAAHTCHCGPRAACGAAVAGIGGQQPFQQRTTQSQHRGADRQLHRRQVLPGAQRPRGQRRQTLYLGGEFGLEPGAEPPFSPSASSRAEPPPAAGGGSAREEAEGEKGGSAPGSRPNSPPR